MKVSHHLHHALGVVIFAGVLIFCDAFSVAPVGLSGAYGGNGVHTRNDKAYGVSWSRNLDAEIQLRSDKLLLQIYKLSISNNIVILTRKQLCPQIPTHIGYQYRFHNETRSCYKLGERGPCGDNMIFFGYQSNAVYGQCDCNYNDNSRALIFDSKRNMCHFIYARVSWSILVNCLEIYVFYKILTFLRATATRENGYLSARHGSQFAKSISV